MSEAKNVVFRSAVSGYNKTDVNEYLLRIVGEFNEKEEALKKKTEYAEKETSALKEKLDEMENLLDEQKSVLNQKNSELEKVTLEKEELQAKLEAAEEENNSGLNEKISEQDAVIAKQFEEIDSLKAELESIKEKLALAESETSEFAELAKKAQIYEKTSANIGEAIISANKTAEEIVAAAKEEARLLTEETQRELDEKRRIFDENTKMALDSIFGKLVAAASENRKEIAGASNYAHQVIEKAFFDIKSRNDGVNARLKSYEESLWKSIKCDLASINATRSDAKKSTQKKLSAEALKKLKKQ